MSWAIQGHRRDAPARFDAAQGDLALHLEATGNETRAVYFELAARLM